MWSTLWTSSCKRRGMLQPRIFTAVFPYFDDVGQCFVLSGEIFFTRRIQEGTATHRVEHRKHTCSHITFPSIPELYPVHTGVHMIWTRLTVYTAKTGNTCRNDTYETQLYSYAHAVGSLRHNEHYGCRCAQEKLHPIGPIS